MKAANVNQCHLFDVLPLNNLPTRPSKTRHDRAWQSAAVVADNSWIVKAT